MRKVLSLAILLLNLFVASNVQAQSYSSELGVGDLIKKAWDNAQNSNADIYAEVYDGNYSDIIDYYSQYGNFTYDVVSGYDLTPYDLSSQGGSSAGVSSGTQSTGSLSVGYYDTANQYPFVNAPFFKWIIYQPYSSSARMCTDIPLYYKYNQNLRYECVACAAGTLADIMMAAGNCVAPKYYDYETVYWNISDYAAKNGIYFNEKPLTCSNTEFLSIFANEAGLNLQITSNVPYYIDNGCAVLGVLNSYSNCVLSSPDIHHMVTICGYDDRYYYCIDPRYITPQGYPISDFADGFFLGYIP